MAARLGRLPPAPRRVHRVWRSWPFFILVALLAPLIAPAEGLEVTKATGGVLEPPSREFWLGTDDKGRSVLTLLIWGARISLFVGLAATVISMVIGTLVGLMSGYFGGWPGAILYRLTEWFLVIPFLPLAIVMATVLGRSLFNIVIVIGVTSWPGTALLIRSQTLTIRERPYLERARVLGGGSTHQIRRHILPNVMPMVFANTTLTVAIAILTETTLSFLGLGDPTRVSWGSMLDDAFAVGAITTGRVVVHRAAGRLRRARRAELHPGRAGARRGAQPEAAGLDERPACGSRRLRHLPDGGRRRARRTPRLPVRRAGEVVGVAGESGCGKSTLAAHDPAAPAADRRRSTGRVLFEGEDVQTMKWGDLRALRWAGASMVFQGALHSLNPVQRVGDQIEEPIRLHEPTLSDKPRSSAASASCSTRWVCRPAGPARTPTRCPVASGSG